MDCLVIRRALEREIAELRVIVDEGNEVFREGRRRTGQSDPDGM